MKNKRLTAILLALAIILSLFPMNVYASNDEFNTADALTVLRASAGLIKLTTAQEEKYDLNGDFIVNTADAVIILRIAAGLPGTPDVMPLMWLVTAPSGQTMYLFGSIHIGDETIYPLPATIMNAFKACDYLAVEFDLLAQGEEDFGEYTEVEMEAYWRSVMYPEGENIEDHIDRGILNAARRAIRTSGFNLQFPITYLDWFKPHMWYGLILEITLWKSGLSHEHGLDIFFLEEAYKRGMGILEIESAESQSAMMINYSNEVYSMLIESSTDINGAAQGINYSFNLWKKGNERVLTNYLRPSINDFISENKEFWDDDDFWAYVDLLEEYNYAMLIRRDIQMAEVAKQYMKEGKMVFFVVGLAHLLGEDSVIDLLRKSNYTVERVVIPF
ncbi:MAG: TraB/GumN family protein [Oscillospiraceae bacterium]|nr:TraB/GumN family protein [Oscillospiraceae bacterium]